MTACATNTNVSSKPSEDLLSECPALEEQKLDNFGDAVRALDYTMDMYFECAVRHNKLIEFERKKL